MIHLPPFPTSARFPSSIGGRLYLSLPSHLPTAPHGPRTLNSPCNPPSRLRLSQSGQEQIFSRGPSLCLVRRNSSPAGFFSGEETDLLRQERRNHIPVVMDVPFVESIALTGRVRGDMKGVEREKQAQGAEGVVSKRR